MPQTLIGSAKREFDTPLLCVDIEQFERNLQQMARVTAAGGKQWRPHAKGHKTPPVAWREIEAGAIGVTCAKLGEAEIFATSGVRNILVANVLATPLKAVRAAALCRVSELIVACDHYVQAEMLSEACQRAGVICRVLVDINIGMNRTGIRPGKDAVELAQGIDQLPGLKLAGVMGYEGHLLKLADPEAKRREIVEAISILEHARDTFVKRGLCCDIVSAGGTGSLHITSQCAAVTELQAGGGVFGDPLYVDAMGLEGCAPAVTILTTVTSRPALNRAILDAGRKTVNPDLCPPFVKGYPDAVVQSLSAEHCTLELGPGSQSLKIGDQVELVVGYVDLTTPLHDEFHVFRGSRLEALWPISARGRLQ